MDATAPADSNQQAAEARRKAMLEPVYRFTVSWRAPNGSMFVGQFAHRVPTISEQLAIEQSVGAARAKAGGHLDAHGENLTVMLAHLERTLTERPSWATDLGSMPYLDLLLAMAGEAMAHCNTFCDPRGGQAPGGELAGQRGSAAAPLVQPAL